MLRQPAVEFSDLAYLQTPGQRLVEPLFGRRQIGYRLGQVDREKFAPAYGPDRQGRAEGDFRRRIEALGEAGLQPGPPQAALNDLEKFQVAEITDASAPGVADQIVMVAAVICAGLNRILPARVRPGFFRLVNDRHNRGKIAQTALLAAFISAVGGIVEAAAPVPLGDQKIGLDQGVDVAPRQGLVGIASAQIEIDVKALFFCRLKPAAQIEIIAPAVEPGAVFPSFDEQRCEPAVAAGKYPFEIALLRIVVFECRRFSLQFCFEKGQSSSAFLD